MRGWLAPAGAAAVWAGILSREPAAARGPAWPWWLLGGLALLAAAAWLAPTPRRGPGPLGRLGLGERGPRAEVAAARPGLGRGPPIAVLLVGLGGAFAVGLGWAGAYAERLEASPLARLAPERVVAQVELRTDPRPTATGWSAYGDAREVAHAAGTEGGGGRLLLLGEGEPPGAVRGDVIVVEGTLDVPEDPGFLVSLRRRGVVAVLRASSVRRAAGAPSLVERLAQWARAEAGDRVRALLPPREAGLLLALALGDERGLDPAVEQEFRASGLSHLLVVSGGNVAMVLAPVLGLALALGLGGRGRFLVGAATVGFFTLVTGAEPAVVRAGVMAALALLGSLLGRPRSAAALLGTAAVILLLLDPALARSVGFQLSVAATAGIVGLAGPLAERMRLLPRPIALAASATLGAQVGVAPLLLFHVHELPMSAIPANVLAFPAVAPALLLGLGAAAAGALWDPLGRLPAAAALLPLRYLEAVAARSARSPLPWITGEGAETLVVGGLAVGLAAWVLRRRRRVPPAALLPLLVLVPLVVWARALEAGPPSRLTVRFFDVGQGDAALVRSPGGAAVLVDGGPDPRQVATRLAALGIRRLDAVVASHAHADHLEGLPAVLGRFPVGVVLEPGCPADPPSYEAFLEAVDRAGVPVLHPRAGDALRVGDLRLEILSPPGCASGTGSDPNNDSLVIELSLREDEVLFAGDAEEPAQRWLLGSGAELRADVLKVPHHGGATSLDAFFAAVDPEVAVVSVGENEYGHPVPGVLAVLRATGARVVRTDLAGEVLVTFSPEGLLLASAPTT